MNAGNRVILIAGNETVDGAVEKIQSGSVGVDDKVEYRVIVYLADGHNSAQLAYGIIN